MNKKSIKQKPIKRINNTKKFLVLLAASLIFILIIYFIFLRKKEVQAPYFSLSLETNQKNEYIQGSLINIDVLLNTDNADTTSANFILSYDPEFLKMLDSDKNKEGLQISEGGIYEYYSGNKTEEKKGEIRLTAYSIDSSHNSHGEDSKFASIKFKALKPTRKTEIKFKFSPSATTDSNIVETKSSKDILNGVKNISLKIKKE